VLNELHDLDFFWKSYSIKSRVLGLESRKKGEIRMSGHSKWSTIKHKKAAADNKRGKVFTKLVKEITVSARDGGGDPEMNPRLRTAIQAAKESNMPSDNIERAIKKGTGELPGVIYMEAAYEGYGPSGIAILVEVLTDNKNRTNPEIKKIFSKRGGSMGASGCVAWMFVSRGFISIEKNKIEEDSLMDLVLDAGVEDLKSEGEFYELYSEINDLESIKKVLQENNIKWEIAETTRIASNNIEIKDSAVAKQILTLIDELEDHEDVQNVYSNFDIDDSILETI